MKKYYILLFAAMAAVTGTAQTAQQPGQNNVSFNLENTRAVPSTLSSRTFGKNITPNLEKTTTCQDTSYYVEQKATGYAWGFFMDAAQVHEMQQAYFNTSNLEVLGIQFYAATDYDTDPGTDADVPVTFSVYNVDMNNKPVGPAIATETGVVVDNGGLDYQTLMFSTPVAVTGNFSVAIGLPAADLTPVGDTIYMLGNSFTNGDGAGENLSQINTFSFVASVLNDAGYDYDFIIEPIIRHTVTAGFSLSDSCLAVNQVTTITDTSTIQSESDNMFNVVSLWSGTNDAWVMGEGIVGDTIYGNPGTFSYATPGSYTITLHDTLWTWTGYCAESHSQTVSVGLAASTNVTHALCNGDNGSVTVVGAGGDAPYTYSDDDVTYAGTDTYTVAPGTATYYVQDGVGCVASAPGTVTQPAALVIVVNAANDPSGCTLTDGSVMITPTGGTPGTGYLFDWDNDGTGDNNDTEDLLTIGAGSYNVIVIDDNNCTATTSATLADPNSPTIVVDLSTDLTCFGDNTGAITTTISGGTGTLVIDWDNDGTGDADDLDDISGLAAGTYNLLVVDQSNCSNSTVVTLTQPDSLELTIAYAAIGCNGDSTDIDVTVAGGVTTYTYDWDSDGYDDAQDSVDAVAGSYTVMVMDASGCLIDSTFTIAEPAALALSAVGTDEMQGNDGEVDLTVTGGTTAYGYAWDNSATTENLTGLVAGTYFVTVTDANGCQDTLSVTIGSQVGISENGISAVVYPNPTNGIVTVEFAQMLDGTITVLDGIGQLVSSQKISSLVQTIDLSSNAKGVYFLQITKGDSNTVVKVLLH